MKNIFALLLCFISLTAFAGEPVLPSPNQLDLLKSSNPKLAHNKRLVYDFARVILAGLRLDQASTFLRQDYIQHNPNVPTGLDGFLSFFSRLGGPRPIPDHVAGLVGIQAEGDFVTLSFVNEEDDPATPGHKYSTTWFDMFRIKDGKIAEHWDCDTKTK